MMVVDRDYEIPGATDMKSLLTLFIALVAVVPALASAEQNDATKDDQNGADDSRPRVVLTDEALAIHRAGLLVDGHNDLPWQMRKKARLSFDRLDISKPHPELNTDIERLRKGGVGAQFWSAYVPADTVRTKEAAHQTLEQIDVIHRMIERYPDVFEMASTADDIERIHAEGRIASMIGVEGGHSIENSLGILRTFYKLGVRYMTLTHSDSLEWADSATDESRSGGLAPFGIEVVQEMNRLGMLVDLSHVSVETMNAAIRASKAPVIFSHSSARAIADHPRNVPDEVLQLMPQNGGVVMVNFFSGFVVPESAAAMSKMFDVMRELKKRYPDNEEYEAAVKEWRAANPIEPGTVHTVVDHIDHIKKVAGIDHVGLGSDFDGVSMLPDQLKDVSCYPYITQELLNRGYTADEIHKVMGGNLVRTLRAAEEVSRSLRD